MDGVGEGRRGIARHRKRLLNDWADEQLGKWGSLAMNAVLPICRDCQWTVSGRQETVVKTSQNRNF
jgi:hypothetical protein